MCLLHQFKDFTDSPVGILVSLVTPPLAEQDQVEEIVVGACAAVQRSNPPTSHRLKGCGLTNSDWEASKELVARHYPAGTRAAGIWLRRDKEEDREEVTSLVQLLIDNTGLKVRCG